MATSARPTNLSGKTALVTGATRGIGLAIAEAMGKNGVHVAITGRNAKTLVEAKKKIGKNSIALQCDVRSEREVITAFKMLSKKFDGLDFLINNAGTVLPIKPLESVTLDEWHTVIETNLTGLFLTTKHALPL